MDEVAEELHAEAHEAEVHHEEVAVEEEPLAVEVEAEDSFPEEEAEVVVSPQEVLHEVVAFPAAVVVRMVKANLHGVQDGVTRELLMGV